MRYNDVRSGMANLASFIAAVSALLGAAALALFGLRTAAQQRFFVAALMSLAGSAALAAPATLQWAVQAEPVPHLVRLTSAGLAMVGSYCLVGVVLYSTRTAGQAGRQARVHAAIMVAWFVLVAVCLYMSGVSPTAVRTPTSSDVAFTAFLVARFVYTGAATIMFLILNHRAIRLPETAPLMRLGFRLTMAATTTAGIHAFWTIGVNLRILRAPISQDVAAVLLGLALTTLALGATAPLWGGALQSVLLRRRVWWAARSLRRLWADLADLRAKLDVTTMARLPAAIQERGMSELYRLCIALRDVQRQARPYVHPAVRGWSEEAAHRHLLDDSSTQTIAEAAELGSALDAVRAGKLPRLGAGLGGEPPLFEQRPTGGPSTGPRSASRLFAETDRLVGVGYALRYSPLVAAIRRRADTDILVGRSEAT